ncbi:hypothetical protein EV424DRAFT_1342292 [Suillus variegatus]|nr:hypothetical protein EV424DRAFT_1342292 [Suillus variegatus]
MSDEPNSGWAGIKVVTEVTKSKYRPGKCATKSLDTKAYIILKHQLWRHFILMLSLCNHYHELHVHIYNHSGSAVSPPFHIDRQKDKFLQILSSIVFGNDERLCALTKRVITQSTSGTLAKSGDAASGEESGKSEGKSDEDSTKLGKSPARSQDTIGHILSHGTICYLARKNDQEYIIKDHWVLGNADDEDTLNEVVMLKKMQGIHGIPELIEFSKVKLSTAIRDIVARSDLPVQQEVHAQGILHHACSLNNAIIEDADDDSLGMLIDWEFTILVTPENNYTISGTGTVLFMSWWLLQQLKNIIVPSTAKKGVASSSPLAIRSVKQDYSDDLESLFYVFSWVCIGYSGPLGIEHHLNASKAWLPHAWSNWSIAGCFDTKVSFYTTDDGKAAITMQFDDYFKDLIPLALEWMDLLRLNFLVQVGSVDGQALHQPIEFNALLKILDKHIAGLKVLCNSKVISMMSYSVQSSPLRVNPKRVKAKRKVAESNITAVTGQGKKAWAADKAGLVSLQLTSNINAPIHCSGRPGAGTGGRNAQLEKVGAVLEAPMRTNLPKGSTTLVLNISANPLAPEPCQKGCGHPPKPPLPYSIADSTGSAVTSSRRKGKKAKTSSAPYSQVEPGVTHKPSHASLQPSLLLREMGGCFGFQIPQGNPPIIPPGTEPDLQAINNPYMTMTKKDAENRAHSAVQSLTGGHQSSSSGPSNGDLLRSASALPCTGPSDFFQGTFGLISTNNSDTSSSDESSGKDSDDPANIDNAGEREFGWAEVGGHHSAHPGFSWEPESSLVHATSILAPDLEFQYSHDDNDMNAKQALAFDNPLISELSSQVQHQSVDVSQGIQESDGSQHHKTNGRPRLPDPASLELLRHVARKKNSTNDEDLDNKQQPAKGRHGPKPTQLSFYPACWKNFLEDAKGVCHAQHALENPFPALVKDSLGSIAEALLAVLVQWDEAGKQFEPGHMYLMQVPGYWPGHKPDMAKLISVSTPMSIHLSYVLAGLLSRFLFYTGIQLYEDLLIWRSELKKNVIVIASTIPGLVPPSNIPPQERTLWVEGAAAGLKAGSKFLHDGVDEQGKTRNFANPALHDAIITFMYTGPYRIVQRHPDIFSKQLPLSCLALFICVLDGLIKNGSRQSFPKFTTKEYGLTYKSVLKSLQDIMKDPYHGPKLVEQLQSWAEAGWQGYTLIQ